MAEELVDKVETLTCKIEQLERERERTAMEVVSLEAALSAKEMELVRPARSSPVIDIYTGRQRIGGAPLDATNSDLKNALAKREQILSRCDDEMNTLVPKLGHTAQ